MREKIKARIKAKFPDAALSENRMNKLLDRLTQKIPDENSIDAKLDEFNEFYPFKEIAAQDDAYRALKNQTPKPDSSKPTETPAPTDQKPAPSTEDDTATILKTLLQEVKELKADKAQTSMRSKVAQELKDIPEKFYSRIPLPKDEAELQDFVNGIKADYQELQQSMSNQAFSSAPPPPSGAGGASKSVAIQNAIKAHADAKKQQTNPNPSKN